MAKLASHWVTMVPRHLYPTVYNVLAPQAGKDYVAALEGSKAVENLEAMLSRLIATDFFPRLPPSAQFYLKKDIALALEGLQVTHEYSSLDLITSRWWALFAAVFTILPVVEFAMIGERVFLVRNLGYLSLFACLQFQFLRDERATPAVYKRLNQDWTTTLVVPSIMLVFFAFVPKYREYYGRAWSTAINVFGTCVAVYLFQFNEDLVRWWNLRQIGNMEKQSADIEHKIITARDEIVELIRDLVIIADTFKYKNYLETTRQGLVHLQLKRIVGCLNKCTSQASADTQEDRACGAAKSVMKIMSSVSTLVQVGITISLWGYWGSFALTFVYSISVCGRLWIMTFDNDGLEVYSDFFSSRIPPGVWGVLWQIPLFVDRQAFEGAGWFAGSTIACAAFQFLLTDPCTEMIKRAINQVFKVKQTTPDEEAVDGAAPPDTIAPIGDKTSLA